MFENFKTGLPKQKRPTVLIILLLMSALFLWTQYRYAFNAPFASDDARMYIGQFEDRFLGQSFFDKIKYFFSETNNPHTKLTGRTLSFLYYAVFGSVNFKYLIMAGSVALVGFVFLARKLLKLEYVLVLPLAFIFLSPERVNFWMGPITGYPFLIIYALSAFYFVSKRRYALAAFIAFVASFSHSPGMAIFLAATPIFLMPDHRKLKPVLIWAGAFGLTVLIYYFMVLSKAGVTRVEDGRSIVDIVKCAPSMMVYEGQFLSLPFVGFLGGKSIVQSLPFLAAFVSASVLIGLSTLLYVRRQSYNIRTAIALSFLLICLIPGPISALVSDDCSTITDNVAERYVMYGLIAWCGIYIFTISSLPKKWGLPLALVFSAIFVPRYIDVYSGAEKNFQNREYIWLQRATFNDESIPWKIGERIIRQSIQTGTYIPVLPKYPTSHHTQTDIAGGLTEFWYDLTINDRTCKLEILTDKNASDVKIWVGKNGNKGRFVPHEANPYAVRKTFKHRKPFTGVPDHPRDNHGYIFAQEASQGCVEEIRVKMGDKLSPPLTPYKS